MQTETRDGVHEDERAAVGAAAAPAHPAVSPADRPSWTDPVCLVAVALVLLPTVAAAVSALRNPWVPTDDWALLELQVRDVGTADTPLVGAWSRFGWDHPGPWPLYLLALPYRLVPAEHGLLFAAAVLNLLAVAACAALALRRGRLQALVVLVGLALLQWGLGAGALGDPWNPLLPIVPFALYCLVCIELVVGPRRWMVAVAAAAASFVVQAHIGFVQPVLLVAAVAGGLVSWRRRERLASLRRGSWRRHRRAAGRAAWRVAWPVVWPAAAVLAVAWLPAAVDQVAGDGNLGLIARWTLGDDLGRPEVNDGSLDTEQVARAASWLLDPAGLWVGNAEIPHALGFDLLGGGDRASLLWIPAALAVAVLAARRAGPGDRWPALGAAAVAAAGVAAVVSDLVTARGLPVAWAFRWVAVVVMLVWVAAGWGVVGMIDARAAGRPAHALVVRRLGAVVALVALVAATQATVWRGSLGDQPRQTASGSFLRLAPAIVEHIRGDDLVVANSEVKIDPVDLGLAVVLDRAGVEWIERSDPRAEGRPVYTVTSAESLDGLTGLAIAFGGAELLARSGPPRDGEPPGSELVLVRDLPDEPAESPPG